jgi:hypothetical protein
MRGIMKGKYFCPMYDDIRLKSCYSRPTKTVLFAKLCAIAEKNKWNLGFTDENLPNKSWIVDILSTFSKEDEIFNKGYVAPPIKPKKEEEKTIAVPKHLLEGLP